MPLDPRAIHVYTDGSCYKNPGGSSGCAAIVHFPDHLGCEDNTSLTSGVRKAATTEWN